MGIDTIRRLARRLSVYWRPDRFDSGLDEDIRFHLEMKTDELVEAGLSPDEARAAALRDFGGVLKAKEACREARGLPLLESLWQDVRFAARGFARSPAFSLLAVATLALGVGANTAIFSVTNAVLLRPLPFADPDRLVVLTQSTQISRQAGFSVDDYADFAARSRAFEQIGAFYYDGVNFGANDTTEAVEAGYVTSSLFPTLGTPPAQGRGFAPEDDRPGAAQTVVISHGLWRDKLGGDPRAIGRTVTLDGKPFEIVGVMPERFQLYDEVDVWLPMGLFPYSRERSHHWHIAAVARLRPDVTIEAAEADVDAVAADLAREYPATNTGRGATLVSLREDMVGDVRPSLRLLGVAVGLVLLIACANVANLLLVRGTARRREIAVRVALGAGPWRVARQLLTESVLLALAGGMLGALVAWWATSAVVSGSAAAVPRIGEPGAFGVDLRVLAFSLVASLVAGLLFGLAPALRAATPKLAGALKEGGRTGSGARSRLRDAFVVGEVALAFVLLASTGLVVKSLLLLRGDAVGYETDGVLAAGLSLPRGSYDEHADAARFARAALERVRALPGVASASVSFPLPVYGTAWGMFYTVDGEPTPEPGHEREARIAVVSPGFFATLGIPLLQGREFADSDIGAQGDEKPAPSAPVAIVDEGFVRANWPDGDAVGRTVTVADVPRTVVGVATTVKNMGLGVTPVPQIYVPYDQGIAATGLQPFAYLSVKTTGDPASLAGAVRGAIRDVDRDVAVYDARPMEELLDDAVAQRHFFALLMQLFAGLALALAAIGVYGVMSYAVAQRSREIGVRIALGARRADVMRLVVSEGAWLGLAGIALGLLAALAAVRLVSSLLFGVSPFDPGIFVGVAALLVAVVLAACCVPALRATRVDPLVALRSE
jgi:putative ABC transport system permease protein